MKLAITKTAYLSGSVMVPSSKSHSIRAILMALMSKGQSCIKNVLDCQDTQDAIRAVTAMGADIHQIDDNLIINSQGLPLVPRSLTIDTGNSGITTHFIMPLLGLRKNNQQPIILNCHEQMRARPVQSLVNALRHLGLHIDYLEKEQQLPIRISGELIGGDTEVDGITSQYLSALLFALPAAKQDSKLRVMRLQERPYVNITLHYLKKQAIQFEHHQNDADTFYIQGRQSYKHFTSTMPGDFSSASYLIAAAALVPGKVTLQGLSMTDAQGDKQLIDLLQKMGAAITVEPQQIIIEGGRKLQGTIINAQDIPDLLPTLAVIGTYAEGKTYIDHVAHARIKETDRIHSMTAGLTRLGAKITATADSVMIENSQLQGNTVDGYGDHRTVMALAIAGLIAEGGTEINGVEAIDKTFPSFINVLQSLGGQLLVKV